MKKIISYLRDHYAEIYKAFLFLLSIVLLVLIFPKEGKFKYEFHKGKPWMHEDLIAPFDFAILKTDEVIKIEQEDVLKELKPYFKFDNDLYLQKREELSEEFEKKWNFKYADKKRLQKKKINNKKLSLLIFDTLMTRGIIELNPEIENKPGDFNIIIITNNIAEEKELRNLFTVHSAYEYIHSQLKKNNYDKTKIDKELLLSLLENSIIQNVYFNAETTNNEKEAILNNISLTQGMLQMGERVISKGELITNNKFQVLESLKVEYEIQLGTSSKYYLLLIGQIILLSISFVVLFFFLFYFKRDIFNENKKVILNLFLIIIMIFITSLVVKYNVSYLYIVPLCLVPIIIRVFFDTRLALYIHLITIIIIGFLVPNSFEFVFLQLIAGIITILSIVNLQKRSQFIYTSVLIFLTYSVIYTGLTLIQEGSFTGIDPVCFALFAGSAVLTLFSYPIIFVFEKLFGFVTDVTLMELSNTNSKLLRELSMKAPGTFQHSLQVANLAEEAIFEIGGNALLVRAGAMYHDIGKIDMSMYFIENQTTGVNPHDELTYEESAKIIISHIIKGIEKAKKYNLPEQIIDFIRTHHGTRKTEYFYSLQKNNFPDEEIDKSIFTYHGPIPFSKETSVLMMADSVEAASRSLKAPDEKNINELVESVINKQLELKQFVNSDITLKEISKIKKIFKKKLMNFYHIRIEYPE